jgi:dihydroorotate dehydrogenase
MYKKLISPFLFLFDPEKIHHLTFLVIKVIFKLPFLGFLIKSYYRVDNYKLKRKLFGLTFPNPIGIAAGFDKNATHISEFANFGFGFIEIGTVTPKPQNGNPKKRLFRLKKDIAVIKNRLKSNYKVIIGGNIGKNKITPNSEAKNDYLICFKQLYDKVDYFAVNVSSPNTPGLRKLQTRDFLNDLFNDMNQYRYSCKIKKPILLKISPDLKKEKIVELLEVIKENKIDGIIATNTTINFPKLQSVDKNQKGGLSGKPLYDKSNDIISFISKKTKGKLPIIGVGGIITPDDAVKKLNAGAHLIQLYTGLIYEGPGIVKEIKNKILADCDYLNLKL